MNSRAIHGDYTRLSDRTSRLEVQLAQSVAELKGLIDEKINKLYHTMVFGGIGAILTILLGVGGINASLVSGMTQAFQVGDGGGAGRSELRHRLDGHEERIAAIEAQTVEIRKIADDIRRSNEEIRKSHEEMRKSHEEMRKANEEMRQANEEMRKSNEAFKAEVRAENAQTRKEVRELKALIELRLPPDQHK